MTTKSKSIDGLTGLTILGTIAHSDGPDHGRVTLLAGDDGMVWGSADGEAPHQTDVVVGREVFAWQGDQWDFWPGSSIRCQGCQCVVDPCDDQHGCGSHCPECGATL